MGNTVFSLFTMNHGFLHVHDDVWRLSPAFDINPNPEGTATNLRTTIDYTRSDRM
jgi:hypothetical protein